ncbi:YgjV family protein [Aureivirga sp. CE67]|uniref:YgjV family protein n=1 Tax=Aureivirga sp. CE67 TaxID=1788983 RepID=UPI0018C995E0|nr:YgjV family protein [Aureivirga sp. CE67]
MIDSFAYLAIATGLYAISKKKMLSFRLWHIASCVSYIIYGILKPATPILISGILFSAIHLFQIYKWRREV